MASKEKKLRKVTTADKTIMYVWDGKLHNWNGPALIPQGDKKKAEYYINGIKYSKEKWKEIKKDHEDISEFKITSKNKFNEI